MPNAAPVRRRPRSRFHGPVRLAPKAAAAKGGAAAAKGEAAAAKGWVAGRAVNLSEGGVGVAGVARADLPDVGDPLECELTLDGARVRLQATVAWVQQDAVPAQPPQDRPPEDPKAEHAVLGLAFSAPGADPLVTAAARSGEPLTTPVNVSFEGREEAVAARAETTRGGLRLSAALPILQAQQAVQVRFAGGPSRPTVTGHVGAVGLDEVEGVPHLHVELVLPNGTGAATRDSASEAFEALAAPEVAPRVAARPAAPAPAGAAARPRGWATALVAAGLGLLVGGAVTYGWLAPAPTEDLPDQPSVATPGQDAPTVAPALPTERPTHLPTESLAEVLAPSPGAVRQRVADAGELEAGAAATATGATAAAAATDATDEPPTETETAPAEISVRGSRDETILTIPVTGDTAGHRSYPLDPPGVVVELPRADTPLGEGTKLRRTGLLRRLLLRKDPKGLQIRSNFMGPRVQSEVKVEGASVTIRLFREPTR